MHTLITIVHVIACVFMILVVLLQSGRGGGVGAAFAGASAQVFGGRGASSFLSRATSVAAVVFFLTSLTLSMLDSRQGSVVRGMMPKADKEAAGDSGDDADKADKASDKTTTANPSEGAAPADTAPNGEHDAAGGTRVEPAAPADGAAAPAEAEKPGKPEAVPPGAPQKPAP